MKKRHKPQTHEQEKSKNTSNRISPICLKHPSKVVLYLCHVLHVCRSAESWNITRVLNKRSEKLSFMS